MSCREVCCTHEMNMRLQVLLEEAKLEEKRAGGHAPGHMSLATHAGVNRLG